MHKKNKEFSKTLLKQESALIWIMSLSFIVLAFYCIHEGFTGSLPWLAAMVGFPWTAYGASQAFYYRKSEKENSKDYLVCEICGKHFIPKTYITVHQIQLNPIQN